VGLAPPPTTHDEPQLPGKCRWMKWVLWIGYSISSSVGFTGDPSTEWVPFLSANPA
jgi:hypothetical protein